MNSVCPVNSGETKQWWSQMFWAHESCGRSVWVTGNMTSILSGHHPSYFNVNTSHLSQICVPFSKTLQHCLHLQNFIPCSRSLCRICSHHSCGCPVLAADTQAPLPLQTTSPSKIKILCFYLFTLQLSVLCLGHCTATWTDTGHTICGKSLKLQSW